MDVDSFLQVNLDISCRIYERIGAILDNPPSHHTVEAISSLKPGDNEESILAELHAKLSQLPASKWLPDRQVLADKAVSVLRSKSRWSDEKPVLNLPPVTFLQESEYTHKSHYQNLFIRYFHQNPSPSLERKQELAKLSGRTLKQVNRWFQNYRCRTRRAFLQGKEVSSLSLPSTTDAATLPESQFDEDAQNLASSAPVGHLSLDGDNDDASSILSESDEDWDWDEDVHTNDGVPEDSKGFDETDQPKLTSPCQTTEDQVPGQWALHAVNPAPFSNPRGPSDASRFDELLKNTQEVSTTYTSRSAFSAHLQLPSYPNFERSSEKAAHRVFIDSQKCWKRKACHGELSLSTLSMKDLTSSFNDVSLRPKKALPRRARATSSRPSESGSSSYMSSSSSRESSHPPESPRKRVRKTESLPIRRLPPSSTSSTPALSRSSSTSSCASDMLPELCDIELLRARLKAVNEQLSQPRSPSAIAL